MVNEILTPCEYAMERHHNIAMWRNLWTILIFAFGAFVVVFLVLAVVFSLREDWLPAALTALATIVEGVSIKWVLNRRSEAVKEEEKAYEDVKKMCRDTTEADNLVAGQKLLGLVR